MINSTEGLQAIKKICADACEMREGNINYILIPRLQVLTSMGAHIVCALLCPTQHSGYTTRLFFDKPLDGAGVSQNWTQHHILDRTWHTWSWQNVSDQNSLMSMLSAHLEALR